MCHTQVLQAICTFFVPNTSTSSDLHLLCAKHKHFKRFAPSLCQTQVLPAICTFFVPYTSTSSELHLLCPKHKYFNLLCSKHKCFKRFALYLCQNKYFKRVEPSLSQTQVLQAICTFFVPNTSTQVLQANCTFFVSSTTTSSDFYHVYAKHKYFKLFGPSLYLTQLLQVNCIFFGQTQIFQVIRTFFVPNTTTSSDLHLLWSNTNISSYSDLLFT